MWDWSNQSLQKKAPDHTSLASVYDDINLNRQSHTPVPTSYHPNPLQDPSFSFEQMHDYIEKMLQKYNLTEMSLIACDYTPQTWEEMYNIYGDYQRARTAFLKLIAYANLKDLIRLGLDEEDITQLKDGITPENFNTHLKIPFDFGGDMSFNNFAFIRTHHTHSNIHRILDMQIAGGFLMRYKKIYIPYFEGKFYYD